MRGGDPADALVATRTSCCLHCLRLGHRTAETLRHVTLECEAYEGCRKPVAKIIHENTGDMFTLCRDIWPWAELRKLAKLFHEIITVRDHGRSAHGPRHAHLHVQAEVDAIWDDSEISF